MVSVGPELLVTSGLNMQVYLAPIFVILLVMLDLVHM